ncbi:rhodanese-like domain-containing protein [Haloechinothrix salitolerans]|uniref:Rhodanese-like domain-containing protein n=1 Tax=Haloechinothrix salitolerans TaxID=926830 RepID=A0ABW2C379_9PSEU
MASFAGTEPGFVHADGDEQDVGGEDSDAVTSEELLRRVKTGTVTVIDVRPREEYRAGHPTETSTS